MGCDILRWRFGNSGILSGQAFVSGFRGHNECLLGSDCSPENEFLSSAWRDFGDVVDPEGSRGRGEDNGGPKV